MTDYYEMVYDLSKGRWDEVLGKPWWCHACRRRIWVSSISVPLAHPKQFPLLCSTCRASYERDGEVDPGMVIRSRIYVLDNA